jgi:double-stranded uracil-DNA glycosylase
MSTPWKPTKEQLLAAEGSTVADVIAPNLRILFCGINPGLYTAAVGHHFARPGNRFWPALHTAGFTDRLLSPFEERELLVKGYGITNIVRRATSSADVLRGAEFLEGGRQLVAKVNRYNPRILAVLGLTAYRAAFENPRAPVGKQKDRLGETVVWVLPNPSGLNAHYQPADWTRLFKRLRRDVEGPDSR